MSTHSRTITLGIYSQESWTDQWTSYEDGVSIGDIRLIEDSLYYAWQVYLRGWFRVNQVQWLRLNEKHMQGENKLPSQRAQQQAAAATNAQQ